MNMNPMKLLTGADFALCQHPDTRRRLDIKINGHEFWIYPAAVVLNTANEPFFINGQISHNIHHAPDDQVYYSIDFKEGMPNMEIEVHHGGVRGLLLEILPVLPIIESIVLEPIGDILHITIKPEKILDVADEINELAKGHGWKGMAAALIAQMIVEAAEVPDYCNQFFWTDWTREQEGPRLCPDQYAASGFACKGHNCSRVKLGCAHVPEGIELDYSKTTHSPFFSEQGADFGANRCVCPADAVVTGVSCRGKRCAELAIACTPSVSEGLMDDLHCKWSEGLSEERGGVINFGRGNAIRGIECNGNYCDVQQFFVCPFVTVD
jgi:hypothetical protein